MAIQENVPFSGSSSSGTEKEDRPLLFVIFFIGGRLFGVDAASIVEVIPLVEFTPVPRAPETVRGLFRFRGEVLPAVDLSVAAGHGTAPGLLSTRILVVQMDDGGLLGLVAEKVTDTRLVDASQIKPSGLRAKDSPFLHGVFQDTGGMVQVVEPDELLTPEVRELLDRKGQGGGHGGD